jgi:hypothetical protein
VKDKHVARLKEQAAAVKFRLEFLQRNADKGGKGGSVNGSTWPTSIG